MRRYTIDDARRLITDFCEEEYGTGMLTFQTLNVSVLLTRPQKMNGLKFKQTLI